MVLHLFSSLDFGTESGKLRKHVKMNRMHSKCLQRTNLRNLLVIGISIGDLDSENQDIHSEMCRVYSVTSKKMKFQSFNGE